MLNKSRALLLIVFLLLLALISAETVIQAQNQTAAPSETATYRVTFTSNWNSTSHPDGDYPASAHWSNLVGATHNSAVTFWQAGGLASEGFERVAESGTNATFEAEVNAAISANSAEKWIQTGLTPFYAPDSTATITLTVQPDFPLLTLATMIAPSPDWFAGVSNLSLQTAEGAWRDSFSLDLFPYDAGTEEGSDYSLSNPATDPHEPIHVLTNVAPFSAEPVAYLTVTLLSPQLPLTETLFLPLILR